MAWRRRIGSAPVGGLGGYMKGVKMSLTGPDVFCHLPPSIDWAPIIESINIACIIDAAG